MSHDVICGDALAVLQTLPSESVHCLVSSPPYFALRDYQTATWEGGDADCDHEAARSRTGFDYALSRKQTSNAGSDVKAFKQACPCGALRVDQQIGLEASPEEYVARLVAVFHEARRVLHPSGVLWLNIGDSYSGYHGNKNAAVPTSMTNGWVNGYSNENLRQSLPGGLKAKDLIGIPWMLAFALRADGWWLRQEVIWSKAACMPESVTDRPTRAHEQLFLLTKRASYYYDTDAIREPLAEKTYTTFGTTRRSKGTDPLGQVKSHNWSETVPTRVPRVDDEGRITGANKRSVWHLGPEPLAAAHFAVMPSRLVEPCILAGSSDRGVCPSCLAPWKRSVSKTDTPNPTMHGSRFDIGKTANDKGSVQPGDRFLTVTTGWEPTCACNSGEPVPATILDPFLGSGTVVSVAKRLGRCGIGIELNPAYVELAWKRINGTQPPLPMWEETELPA